VKYLLKGEETERLLFRPLTANDFSDWLPLLYKHDVAFFLGMDVSLTPLQHCEQWFKKSLARYKENTGGMNVLLDKHSGKLIGQCGLLIQDILGEKYLEISYSILPKYFGKGFATEAVVKCKNFAFENNLSRVLISMVHIDNFGSETVAKRKEGYLE
jgi:ribosomal-protein-alanine N-acetyltransferase